MTELDALKTITEELILARLLVASAKEPWPKGLRTQVIAVFPDRLTTSDKDQVFDSAIERLKSAGDLAPKPLRLSAAGRDRGLRAWGITKLPPHANWNTLKQQVIIPKLFGIPAERISKAKKKSQALAISLLGRKHSLPAEANSPAKVVDALAWEAVEISSTAKFSAKAVVAQRLLGQKPPDGVDALITRLAIQTLGQQSKDLFRTAIQRALADAMEHAPEHSGLVSGENGRPPAEQEDAINRFAAQAQHAASRSPSGRFGDNKVFISHAWKEFEAQPGAPQLSLEEFKQQLLEAHRRRSIELARADLVERMDPGDVTASEIRYLGSSFHFIRVEA